MHELLVLLVVFVLGYLLLLKLSLVLFSVVDNSLGYVFNSDIAVDIEFLVNAEFLSNLIGINVLVLIEDMILIGRRVNNLGDIETLNLVLADLIVASNNNVIHILASENHEHTLVK